MIKGQSAVLDYFDLLNAANDNEYIYFSIFKKGNVEKSNPSITTPQKKEWNIEQSRDMLSKWLSMQQYGEFTILLNDREQASARGGKRQDFTIDSGSSYNPIAGPTHTADDIAAMVNTKVNEILQKKENEKELADAKAKVVLLEKEKKELEKEAHDPWNKFIGSINPFVPDILKEMGVIKTKVAGIPQSEARPVKDDIQEADVIEGTGDDADNQRRLEQALKKLAVARKADWLELLELIADAIEKNPSLADKVKLFL